MADNASNPSSRVKFPVVGLGASAGGLEALNAFFDAMPANSNITFIVVQHLSVHQDSILHELLQMHTAIKVQQIVDNTPLQANRVYVLPSGYELHVQDHTLRLTPIGEIQGWPETINRFFTSLALDQGDNAAVLVLSGAGHDGTAGARMIRNQGGLVIAQALETASQSSMPFHVIDAGLANAILAPNLMPEYLLNHFGIDTPDASLLEDLTVLITDGELKRVIRLLRRQTGYDFGDYKVSTIRRQIARRMGSHQLNIVNDYLALMEQQPEEANQLVKGLLIHVTSFFRDPESFEILKQKTLLPLLKTLSIDDVFRVWVPGCASGEEAVSLAILIYECLREINLPEMQVRIFATDVSRDLIQNARNMIYPSDISEHISATRLKEHFISLDIGYQVRAHISRMIVWAEHNLIEHPPFSSLYLISCRNVLIYFQAKLQERIHTLFHFALRPEGILFLGSSEAMPSLPDMFTVIDSKHKIYQRMRGVSHQWMRLDHPLFAKPQAHTEETMPISKHSQHDNDDYKLQLIKEMLLTYYHSTCVIVDERYHISYTYGEVDYYLRLIPGGEEQYNIVNMARDGLDAELTIALYEAFNSDRMIMRQGVWVKAHTDERLINLIVMPIQDNILGSRYRLVIFEPAASHLYPKDATPENPTGEEGVTIARLRDELQQMRRILQTATQALQAKSEELTSTMEEISSANEEIQTTNEELRTSKEELESMNEELNTLNTQLISQNHELSNANNSLYNFLQSTAVGVIFLDQKLNIREYSQSATTFFSLRKSDVGRPLAEISSQLNYANLISDASQVLDSLVKLDQEVTTTDGRWYKIEIRPYRMMNNAIDGLVLTFNDISVQKQAQQTAEHAALYVRKIIDTLDNSIIELDSHLQIIAANMAFYQQFQVKPEETVGKFFYGLWDIPSLQHLLYDIIPQQTFVRDYVVTYDFPHIGKHTIHLNAHHITILDRILVVITQLINENDESK